MGLFAKLGARYREINEVEFEKLLSDIQKELAIEAEKYHQKQLRLIDIEISEEKNKRLNEIAVLAIACADEKGQYEHHFHHTMELRGIEIAKLEAKAEALKDMEGNDTRCYKEIIKNKDGEIEYLKRLIDKMVDTAAHINEVKLTHTYKGFSSGSMINSGITNN